MLLIAALTKVAPLALCCLAPEHSRPDIGRGSQLIWNICLHILRHPILEVVLIPLDELVDAYIQGRRGFVAQLRFCLRHIGGCLEHIACRGHGHVVPVAFFPNEVSRHSTKYDTVTGSLFPRLYTLFMAVSLVDGLTWSTAATVPATMSSMNVKSRSNSEPPGPWKMLTDSPA